MAVPKEPTWPRDPHTAAKHDLLRKYLAAWAPILLSRHEIATYAEGFSGPGVYKAGEPGSPVIAHGVFAGALQRHPKRLRMFLMEKDPRRVEELRRQMARAQERQTNYVNQRLSVHIDEGEFHPALLQRLRASGSLGQPLFVLLDSYGGPDIPYSLLRELAVHDRTEVMVTFVPSFLTRFAEKREGHRQQGDTAFGGQEWQAVFKQPSTEKFSFLRDQYRDCLHRAGFKYTLHFEMMDEGGRLLYLIFGTKNDKGLEKMKDAMWGVDPNHGVRYRDPKDPDQQELELEWDPDTAPLRRILREHVVASSGGLTVTQLKRFTLLETVYRPAQVIRAIRKLREAEAVATDTVRVSDKTLVLPPQARPTGPTPPEQDGLW
ncbi:three-Cys-motif partner protein TcmP [Streptomyces sp. G1]|uniref:three-Cys-motif partner protein TcmP n=1 Tax=Streptomyces sp. G1 TaxID=361572 RepID=UPI00202FF8F4|nr:three-Cys-motif partner protein TcmP [Streptomyces sp. G1]MCM1967997.1 three-Cys-motif partner protein TcmP [Streptomyces sp. G1]